MVATLARSGSTFTTGNQRSFDAWGGIRGGPQSGSPKGRYCANLGHVQDDESGLIYMRARYYEPGTGRFISEDPGENGGNWYVYCKSTPLSGSDESGKVYVEDMTATFQSFMVELQLADSAQSFEWRFEQYMDKMVMLTGMAFDAGTKLISEATGLAEVAGPEAGEAMDAAGEQLLGEAAVGEEYQDEMGLGMLIKALTSGSNE